MTGNSLITGGGVVTAVKDGSDGVASEIRGFGAGNEGKSAVKKI